ncbi:hypothetical protein [Methylobacterium tardum]|uniref:hypothetical protein n=1 Tax=Methylobacterium tardum TaxID=374432 RepID=UPI00360F64A9
MTAAAVTGGATAPPRAAPAPLSEGQKVFAFAVMCIGFFIALLDIQIVSASLKDIGGGRRRARTRSPGSRPATSSPRSS